MMMIIIIFFGPQKVLSVVLASVIMGSFFGVVHY